MKKSLRPTRKWWATQVTAVSAWLVALIQAGYEVSTTLAIAAVGIVAQAIIGWLFPNEDTPGGVPRAKARTSYIKGP